MLELILRLLLKFKSTKNYYSLPISLNLKYLRLYKNILSLFPNKQKQPETIVSGCSINYLRYLF